MNKDFVLVIGAAHIDVMADYDSAHSRALDRIGEVRYAIGGTGYNIAIDLAQAYVRTSLVTVLKKSSFSSLWVKTRLAEAGVSLDLIQTSERVPESGFVAIRKDRELELAVTSTAIASVALPIDVIESAIENCCLIVADCNLSEDQLALITRSANHHKRPILVAGVSDSKASRIAGLDDHARVDVFSINELEFLSLFAKPLGSLSTEDIKSSCARVHSNFMLVTRSEHGYVVLSSDGRAKEYKAPSIGRYVSSTGAGDATLAAVAAYWYHNRSFDWDGASALIARMVRKVIEEEGATPGSLASEVDFKILVETVAREVPRSFYERIMQSHLAVGEVEKAAKPHGGEVEDRSKSAPKLFISHRHKDEAIAAALVDVIRSAFFIDKTDIRCSSVRPYRLPVGERTPDRLRDELGRAEAVIGIVTPDTKESSYVLFELGGAWAQRILTCPVFARGGSTADLPDPIRDLNPLSLADARDCQQLLDNLEDATSLKRQTGVGSDIADRIQKLVQAAKVLD